LSFKSNISVKEASKYYQLVLKYYMRETYNFWCHQ